MNLETLINIILLFLFLLITTFVRGLKSRQQKKKMKTQKQSAKPGVFSFFQKIRDQIQESLQELERQAREKQRQRKPEPEPSDTTFWDELPDEEEIQDELEKPRKRQPENVYTLDQTEDPIQKMAPEVQVQGQEIKTSSSPKEVPPPTIHPYGRRPSLRQAVVWAEIIGKPVALRKDPSDAIL